MHSINTIPIESNELSNEIVSQSECLSQPISQLPEGQLSMYSSLELFAKRDNFSIGDGVIFWAFNKWQPISGCCKIIAIDQDPERTDYSLISIGSRDDILICTIKECRVCWFPNWTSSNVLKFECIELDSSLRFNEDLHKWDGQRLCVKHSRNYIPFSSSSKPQKSKYALPFCAQDALYDIGGRQFLSSQTLSQIVSRAAVTSDQWLYPASFIKWSCEISGIDFKSQYPAEYEHLLLTPYYEEARAVIFNKARGIDGEDSDMEDIPVHSEPDDYGSSDYSDFSGFVASNTEYEDDFEN